MSRKLKLLPPIVFLITFLVFACSSSPDERKETGAAEEDKGETVVAAAEPRTEESNGQEPASSNGGETDNSASETQARDSDEEEPAAGGGSAIESEPEPEAAPEGNPEASADDTNEDDGAEAEKPEEPGKPPEPEEAGEPLEAEEPEEIPEISRIAFSDTPPEPDYSGEAETVTVYLPVYELSEKAPPSLFKKFIDALTIFARGKHLLETRLAQLRDKYDEIRLARIEYLNNTAAELKRQNEGLAAENARLEVELMQLQQELLAEIAKSDRSGSGTPSDSEGSKRADDSTGGDGEAQNVYAVPEDVIAVSLEGNGWVFTGVGGDKRGITFKARENAEGYTEFVFLTAELGEYRLNFRKQDLFTGEDESSTVLVSVVSPERFSELLNLDGGETNAQPRGFILADSYYSDEQYEDALEEYLKNYIEGNPKVNQRIAELSFNNGDYEDARLFWEKNLHVNNDTYREKAVAGLLSTAIETDDPAVFKRFLPELTRLQRVEKNELLEKAIEYQIDRAELTSAVRLLEEYVTEYYGNFKSDWAYFTLGALHEQAGPVRDLQKAKHYYRVVIQDFPASAYYDKADERIRYIDKNFLHVR